jgi:hypothetical protein
MLRATVARDEKRAASIAFGIGERIDEAQHGALVFSGGVSSCWNFLHIRRVSKSSLVLAANWWRSIR